MPPVESHPGPRTWLTAAMASLVCSAFFLLLYPLVNAITAHRHDVGVLYADWEMAIPFIPLLFIPYVSLDLFFVAAPFICTTKEEIKTLAARLTTATLLACLFFLMIPLRAVFPRVPVDGYLGPLFDAFRLLDQPYNQFPSLHVALAFILIWTYHRHLRGAWLILFHLWFALIIVSTLFVHQHQAIDLVGGFLLAVFCLYLFPGNFRRQRYKPTRTAIRLAAVYAVGAGLLYAAAIILGGWAWLLLYPCLSLSLVAMGYLFVGPAVFRKRDGVLTFPAVVMLGPYLLGMWVHRFIHWRRNAYEISRITPRLYLAGRPVGDTAKEAAGRFNAWLDVTLERSTPAPLRHRLGLCVPILDLIRPGAEELKQAVHFLAAQEPQGPVLVFCALGLGRSAAITAAYIVATDQAPTAREAYAMIRAVRPGVVMRDAMADLIDGLRHELRETARIGRASGNLTASPAAG